MIRTFSNNYINNQTMFKKDIEDMEDGDEVEGSTFYNDLYKLDLTSSKWTLISYKYDFVSLCVLFRILKVSQ